MKITVLYDQNPRSLVDYDEGGGILFSPNFCKNLPDYGASHPRRL
jgi:hypothetical protein